MLNPTLTRKTENTLTITENTKKLFQAIYREQKEEARVDDEIPKIKVSALISKMAFYYEKIRNAIDYKEEQLLRKNAIERILKRQIVIEGAIKELKSEEMAKYLLTELIRAGYLPNNKIPEDKIYEISQVINKYIKLKNYTLVCIKNGNKIKNETVSWIITMAACDIEERLNKNIVNQTVISNMYEILNFNIKLPENSQYQQDKKIQIYLSIHRNLLKFDNEMLEFILFKYFNNSWQEEIKQERTKDEEITKLAQNITVLRKAIDKQINHPLAGQFNRIISRYTVFFTVLIDVIADDPAGVYNDFKADPKAFPRQIKKICGRKYKQAHSKLWRAAMRSIIYIFLTKSIFVILLEIPAIKWFGEEINLSSLTINIGFPAFLLFLIVLFTKLPSEDNSKKIIEGINEIVFEEKTRKEPFGLKKAIRRNKLMNAIFGIIYIITFFLSFGLIIWALGKIGFTWISTIIFLFFLALVSFFGIRIRKGAHELIITEPKENIFNFIADFFYTPIVAAGKWLSEKFSRINLFIFILDFIIEAPFKIFVEITEEWTK
ncbi:MAG: hypothetical protein U9R14_00125, partial [Patescibacteria group bacterium]|nr:hypothetical protein [Patescibacteria group bacterium]